MLQEHGRYQDGPCEGPGSEAAPGWDTPSVALWTFHFPQEIGKIHAMGKSKYSWPKPLAAAAVAAMSLPQLQAKGRETSS